MGVARAESNPAAIGKKSGSKSGRSARGVAKQKNGELRRRHTLHSG